MLIGDYNDSRYIPNSAITSSNVANLKVDWSADTSNDITGMPIVANGSVYFADWGGFVYSVNFSDGSTIWKDNMSALIPNWTGNMWISNTLAVENGLVFGGLPNYAATPEAFALNQTTGNLVWLDNLTLVSQTTDHDIWGSPTLYNGMMYIGLSGENVTDPSEHGQIVALNMTNGNLIWKFTTMIGASGGASVWSTPVVDPTLNAIYFGTGNPYSAAQNDSYAESIISLNAENGALNWVFPLHNVNLDNDEDVGSSPNLFTFRANGTTYQAVGEGSKDGNYYILNRENGNLLENLSITPGSSSAGIYSLPGFIYVGPNNPELFIASVNATNHNAIVTAYFPANDTYAWTDNDNAEIIGSITVIPGAVVYPDNQGYITAVSTTNGNVLYRKAISSGSIRGGIEISGNMMLFGSSTGVYALSLSGSSNTNTTSTTTSSNMTSDSTNSTTTSSSTNTTSTTTSSSPATTSSSTTSAVSTTSSSTSQPSTSTQTSSSTSKTSGSGFPSLLVGGIAAVVAIVAIATTAIYLRRRKEN